VKQRRSGKIGRSCRLCYYLPDEFMVLNENKFVCRAIDNRMGGFMIAEVLAA
jgi:putative aminopeptidase FrvX